MALTINPAVSRGRTDLMGRASAFLGGTTLGALASAAVMLTFVAALESLVPSGVIRGIGAAVVIVAAGRDLGLPIRLPYRQRQVPEWLRDALPPAAVAFIYGIMLGVGFLTLFTYSTHVAMLIALTQLSSLGEVLGVVVLFAVGKTVVLASAAGVASVGDISARFAVSSGMLRLLRVTTAALSLLVAAHVTLEA